MFSIDLFFNGAVQKIYSFGLSICDYPALRLNFYISGGLYKYETVLEFTIIRGTYPF